jgi:hypothetical protein
MHTARFWYLVNGHLTKLSVYHQERLRYSTGGDTDEGSSWVHKEFTYRNGVVTCKTHIQVRDCDGPFESWNTYTADINDIHPIKDTWASCLRYSDRDETHDKPETRKGLVWKRQSSRQRDYYAESMGY